MSYRPSFATEISSVERGNTVEVESLNGFPAAVAGKITLRSNTKYILTKNVFIGDVEFIIPTDGLIAITSSNILINNITSSLSAGKTLFSGDINRLDMRNMNFVNTTGMGTFLNIGTGVGVTAFFFQQNRVIGFGSIGTVEGVILNQENVAFIACGAGVTYNDMGLIQVAETNFIFQSGNHITVTGDNPFVIFNAVAATPSTGDAIFNFDPALTTGSLEVTSTLFITTGGGDFLDSGSLDQTDPRFRFVNNNFFPDSNHIGSIGFEGSTQVTAITTLNTYTDITGTFVDNELERFTRSGDTVTYTGLEDIKALAEIDITASRDSPASSSRTIRTAVFLDNGSTLGFVDQGSASMDITGNPAAYAFTVPLELSTGDIIKGPIKNEDTTDDIKVIDYSLTVRKL